MSTPYDGPERRMYDAANRRLALNTIRTAIRMAVNVSNADARAKLIAIVRENAPPEDAAIVERMIADALGAHVVTPTEP